MTIEIGKNLTDAIIMTGIFVVLPIVIYYIAKTKK